MLKNLVLAYTPRNPRVTVCWKELDPPQAAAPCKITGQCVWNLTKAASAFLEKPESVASHKIPSTHKGPTSAPLNPTPNCQVAVKWKADALSMTKWHEDPSWGIANNGILVLDCCIISMQISWSSFSSSSWPSGPPLLPTSRRVPRLQLPVRVEVATTSISNAFHPHGAWMRIASRSREASSLSTWCSKCNWSNSSWDARAGKGTRVIELRTCWNDCDTSLI